MIAELTQLFDNMSLRVTGIVNSAVHHVSV